jgi:hypothetical protein
MPPRTPKAHANSAGTPPAAELVQDAVADSEADAADERNHRETRRPLSRLEQAALRRKLREKFH